MKTIILLLFILSLQGCLYFNDRGVSGHLYDNCHSYYDENGEFVELCDENIIDYDEAQEGVVALKDEIKENVHELKDTIVQRVDTLTTKVQGKGSGINIEALTPQERYELLQNMPQITIKEEIEPDQCPCK